MTLLITDKTPPNLLSIVIASPLNASLRVFASLILLAANPVVITKYFLLILIPSGVLPSSARTTTD